MAVPRARSTLIVVAATLGCWLALSASAAASDGTWERAWGKGVNGGGVFGICTIASNCLSGFNGTLGGEMNTPIGVAADPNGNVYVADYLSNRIQKFDSSGNWLLAWGKGVNGGGGGFEVCTVAASCQAGSAGGLGGEMTNPVAVASDASGDVYVADQGGRRIQRFDSSGTFELTWGKDVNMTTPGSDLCTAASGDTCQAGTIGTLGGEMANPIGVATDASGNVYVADGSTSHRIQRFSSSGTWERAWGKDVGGIGVNVCTTAGSCQAGAPGGLGGEFNSPSGIATDGASVYVADTENKRVQKFDPLGTFELTWGRDVNMTNPGSDLCTAASGDTCQAGTTGTLGGEMAGPFAVAASASGKVYVADTGNNRIQKFDASGTWERAWGRNVNGGGVFGVCTVASSCLAGTPGVLGGEMSSVQGVATQGSNVFVSEGTPRRIQKFRDGPLPPGGGGGAGAQPPATAPAPAKKKCKKGFVKKKVKGKTKCVKKKRK